MTDPLSTDDSPATGVGDQLNISLRQMRAFAAVCRHGSFTQAATHLHLSQSAVSMLVRQLESGMSLTLFNRGRTTLTLTEAGRELLPLVQRILDDLQRVKRGASDLRQLRRGTLRIVVSQMLACTWILPVLAQFRTRYPEIEVQLTDAPTDGVVAEVRRGEVDLGLGPQRPPGDDVVAMPFRYVPICLVCPAGHPLARRRHVSWEETRQERWVVYSSEFFRQLEATLRADGLSMKLDVGSQVSYLTTALAMVGAGGGVTAAPQYVSSMALHFGVRFVPLRSPVVTRVFQIYQRTREACSPAAAAFIDMLHAQPSAALPAAPAGHQES